MTREARALLRLLGLISIAVGAGLLVRLITGVLLGSSVSSLLGVAAFGYALVSLDEVFGGPLRRIAKPVIDRFEYRYQHTRAAAEIRRKIGAIEEENRLRAAALTAQVHEEAARATAEGALRLELEDLKGRSEEVVMQSQSIELARVLARYQSALWQVKKAEHMTAEEKARLLADMRSVLAAEDGAPLERIRFSSLDEAQTLSQSNQPAVVLEYRAPGGEAVPVTARGFRKLVERKQLGDDDECRMLGSSAWISVAEMRGGASRN